MFNFLKKKGGGKEKEKSTFFDNKIVSTPKTSNIFKKFVLTSDSNNIMGQNNSSDKTANANKKNMLKKTDSKDEEFNTAPNSPEIQKSVMLSESNNFLSIDDDSDDLLDIDDDSSTFMLQNNDSPSNSNNNSNNQQNKQQNQQPLAGPSNSTSNNNKITIPPVPSASVVLKSTPDAFYNRKNNKRNNHLKNQSRKGSLDEYNNKGNEKNNNHARKASLDETITPINNKNNNNTTAQTVNNASNSPASKARNDFLGLNNNKHSDKSNNIAQNNVSLNNFKTNSAPNENSINHSNNTNTSNIVSIKSENNKPSNSKSDTIVTQSNSNIIFNGDSHNTVVNKSKNNNDNTNNVQDRKTKDQSFREIEIVNTDSKTPSSKSLQNGIENKNVLNGFKHDSEINDKSLKNGISRDKSEALENKAAIKLQNNKEPVEVKDKNKQLENGISNTINNNNVLNSDDLKTDSQYYEKENLNNSKNKIDSTIEYIETNKTEEINLAISPEPNLANTTEGIQSLKTNHNNSRSFDSPSKVTLDNNSKPDDKLIPSDLDLSISEKNDIISDNLTNSKHNETFEIQSSCSENNINLFDRSKTPDKTLREINSSASDVKGTQIDNTESFNKVEHQELFNEETKKSKEPELYNETNNLLPGYKTEETDIIDDSKPNAIENSELGNKEITETKSLDNEINTVKLEPIFNKPTSKEFKTDDSIVKVSDKIGFGSIENNIKEESISEEHKSSNMEEADSTEEESEDEEEDSKNLNANLSKEIEPNIDKDKEVSEPPPRKYKKFVRFVLANNTYHGSDTESSEEEEEEDDEEEEEEEEEEVEEEEAKVKVENVEEEEVEEEEDEEDDDDEEEENENSAKVKDKTKHALEENIELKDSKVKVDLIEPVKVPGEEEIIALEKLNESMKSEYENRIHEYDDRIHNLTSDLELRQLEMNQLKGKIGELENKVLTKTWAMDRQEAELNSAMKESEHVRQKLRRLESDMNDLRMKNSELCDELNKKISEEKIRKEETCDFFKIRELEEKLMDASEKIKALEEQLNNISRDKDVAKEAEKIKKAETEVEMKIMREALDEALKQKSILQKRFESEFKQLRNVNTDREQQLLDDFEWKLREVEQSCKKKIMDADKAKKEMEARVVHLTEEVEELSKFKNLEAEANQLRSVSHEHQRTIRTITRQKEELQVNEKILNEELTRLRASLEKEKAHIVTLQAIHSREITEKNRKHQFKLDQQKNELQEQFEERLKKELLKTKVENEKNHLEDKRVAVEHTKSQCETKLQDQKKKWEKQLQEALKQVESLRERLKEKDRVYKQDLESTQTHSDQSQLEMRRKMDKLDMTYQEQIEKCQEKHEKEIERINEEYERRLNQAESTWQQQLSTTRTTLELVKEQMRRDTYEQIQHLKTQHQRELEEQWSRLIQERDEALAELEQRHRTTIEQLRNEIELRTKKNHSEAELLERMQQLQQEIDSKNKIIANLEQTVSLTSAAPNPVTSPIRNDVTSPIRNDVTRPIRNDVTSPTRNDASNSHQQRTQKKIKRTLSSEHNTSINGGSPVSSSRGSQKVRKSASSSQVATNSNGLDNYTEENQPMMSEQSMGPGAGQQRPPRRKNRGRKNR